MGADVSDIPRKDDESNRSERQDTDMSGGSN